MPIIHLPAKKNDIQRYYSNPTSHIMPNKQILTILSITHKIRLKQKDKREDRARNSMQRIPPSLGYDLLDFRGQTSSDFFIYYALSGQVSMQPLDKFDLFFGGESDDSGVED